MSIVNYDPVQLEAAVRYWQRMFRFQDWKITVLFVSKECFASKNTSGDSNTDAEHRQAVIRVREHKELEDGFILDYRDVIAHEFVHCLGWDMPRPGKDGVPNWLFEQTVETLAQGIAAMTPWDDLPKIAQVPSCGP